MCPIIFLAFNTGLVKICSMESINRVQLEKRLRDRNLRPTKARLSILALFQSPDINHLTCEEVVKTLLKKDSSLGQATLYQNVNILAESGVLTRYTGPDGMLLHEALQEHHHHIICKECGNIMDILIEGHCDNLKPYPFHSTEQMTGWEVRDVMLEFYGLCPDCT